VEERAAVVKAELAESRFRLGQKLALRPDETQEQQQALLDSIRKSQQMTCWSCQVSAPLHGPIS